MGISVFLPQWNLATWMELKIRFTENPWNRALSQDEQKKEKHDDSSSRGGFLKSPHVSHLRETGNHSFPALKLTLESKLLGIYK